MLAWKFAVSRLWKAIENRDPRGPEALVWWTAAAGGGERWIEQLVALGKADFLGGDGYPYRYILKAATLLEVLRNGPPEHNAATVIGEDYYLPEGWIGNVHIHLDRLRELPPSEVLLIDQWDQS